MSMLDELKVSMEHGRNETD